MKDSLASAYARIPFAASAIFWLIWQRWQTGEISRRGRCQDPKASTTVTDLHLLPGEQNRLIKCPPACSITFYRGVLPTEYLAGRIKDILIVNPFLTSRLIKPSFFSKEVIATYDSNPIMWCLSDYFEVVEDSSIAHDMPYQELMLRINKYRTKIGTQSINRNESVFKITLIHIESDSYALFASLNHSIGDGHTFYKLLGMLSQSTTPYALDPVRYQKFETEVEVSLDQQMSARFKSPLVVCGFLYNALVHSPLQPHVCVVDKNWIDKTKLDYQQKLQQQHSSEVMPLNNMSHTALFLSTNDILTSWYYKFCQCTFGAMVVNFRNRLQGCTDAMAGNYVRSVLYCTADTNRPEHIRESLHRISRPIDDPPTHTPLRIQGRSRDSPDNAFNPLDLLTLNVSGATNWASFYEDVVLPGGAMVLHLPVMSLAYMGARACLIIFKCNKQDTAVVLWGGTSTVSRKELEKEPIFSRIL